MGKKNHLGKHQLARANLVNKSNTDAACLEAWFDHNEVDFWKPVCVALKGPNCAILVDLWQTDKREMWTGHRATLATLLSNKCMCLWVRLASTALHSYVHFTLFTRKTNFLLQVIHETGLRIHLLSALHFFRWTQLACYSKWPHSPLPTHEKQPNL